MARIQSGQVDPRFRHQRCQPGNKVEGFEDDMRRAVSVRRLQLVPDVAVRRQLQALFRDRRSADVPTQPLELLALICPRRDTGVQRESGDLPDPVIEGLVTRRQRLQREHLATSLRPDGDAVGDRRTQKLFHRAQSASPLYGYP